MNQSEFRCIDCVDARYLADILAIFNEEILNSTALYEYQSRSMAFMQQWLAVKLEQNFPIIGLVNANDQLIAFATWGNFEISLLINILLSIVFMCIRIIAGKV